MLTIPYGADLGLGRRSYVTYAIVVLCILIHLMQDSNRDKIDEAAEKYCTSIYQSQQARYSLDDLRESGSDESFNIQPEQSLDILRDSKYECEFVLPVLHQDIKGILRPLLIKEIEGDFGHLDETAREKMMALVDEHYEAFSLDVPADLDAKLMYYPDSWNPFTTLTSTLSHGDWWHLIGNLIFFMAFAPAIELLIGNRLKYVGFLLAISFVTSVTYSLTTLIGQSSLPTLGLSGVVMGVIGMSGFLMPRVKIMVFVWFFTIIKTIYVSAWILALWYIGWDAWDMLSGDGSGGVNLVAHVSGGIAGYLLAYYFLGERREEIHDELHDEIEYSRSQRVDSGSFSSHVGTSARMKNEETERAAKKDHSEMLSRLHKYVRDNDYSNAIIFMLDQFELTPSNAELYEELFNNMHTWGMNRALLCAGRAAIYLLMINKLTARALIITEKCQKIDSSFCLATPKDVVNLALCAKDQHQYKVAYSLVKQAGIRYGFMIDVVRCKLIETTLLWHHLGQADEARRQMKILLNMNSPHEKDNIRALAASMEMSK